MKMKKNILVSLLIFAMVMSISINAYATTETITLRKITSAPDESIVTSYIWYNRTATKTRAEMKTLTFTRGNGCNARTYMCITTKVNINDSDNVGEVAGFANSSNATIGMDVVKGYRLIGYTSISGYNGGNFTSRVQFDY